jgi:hypothetical protein
MFYLVYDIVKTKRPSRLSKYLSLVVPQSSALDVVDVY